MGKDKYEGHMLGGSKLPSFYLQAAKLARYIQRHNTCADILVLHCNCCYCF